MVLQDIKPDLTRLDESVEFAARLATYMPFLRAFANSLGGHQMAEDLAQETAARAWQFRGSFAPGTNMKAWLGAILRNQFISHQRRRWRQTPWTDVLERTIAGLPEEQPWRVELSDAACAMNALPEKLRVTMILVCVCGFSYEEIALLLTISLGTVKSRICRARQSLLTILQAEELSKAKQQPANANSLNDWFVQIESLRDRACRTLASGRVEEFYIVQTIPKMALKIKHTVSTPGGPHRAIVRIPKQSQRRMELVASSKAAIERNANETSLLTMTQTVVADRIGAMVGP